VVKLRHSNFGNFWVAPRISEIVTNHESPDANDDDDGGGGGGDDGDDMRVSKPLH
jgi:hypothetical protein